MLPDDIRHMEPPCENINTSLHQAYQLISLGMSNLKRCFTHQRRGGSHPWCRTNKKNQYKKRVMICKLETEVFFPKLCISCKKGICAKNDYKDKIFFHLKRHIHKITTVLNFIECAKSRMPLLCITTLISNFVNHPRPP